MATVNQQIDALLKRGKNPALSEEDATFVREARARIKELDALVLNAIDKRQWTAADKLDVQRGKLWKAIDIREGRKPRSNNPRKTASRKVTLVAARNPRKTDKRLRANRPVSSSEWLRFKVQEKRSESGAWIHTAGFHKKSDAETYAKALHKIRPDMFFRVVDPS